MFGIFPSAKTKPVYQPAKQQDKKKTIVMIENLLYVSKITLLAINIACVFLSTFFIKRSSVNDASLSKMKTATRKKILLIVAHPDDEAMFFTPTIGNMKDHFDVFVLCLSAGNADKLGATRIQEFWASCKSLGILPANAHKIVQQEQQIADPETRVILVDNEQLFKDGMQTQWQHERVASFVAACCKLWQIDTLLTFDEFGISSHANHIAVHHGCKLAAADAGLEMLCLHTTNWLNKYCSFASIYWQRQHDFVFVTLIMTAAYNAMEQHASQFVWFRKLFIVFSSYAYMNVLIPYNANKKQS